MYCDVSSYCVVVSIFAGRHAPIRNRSSRARGSWLETREESHLGLQPASEAAHVERGARGARHQLVATIATTETRQERAKRSNEHG